MLIKDQKKRIGIEEILKHPWITGGDKVVEEMRKTTSEKEKFEAFTLDEPDSPVVRRELKEKKREVSNGGVFKSLKKMDDFDDHMQEE